MSEADERPSWRRSANRPADESTLQAVACLISVHTLSRFSQQNLCRDAAHCLCVSCRIFADSAELFPVRISNTQKEFSMNTPEGFRSPSSEQTAVRKILARLVPFLALLYVFNLLDRGNVSIAALTMQNDLHFSDRIYGLGAGIFFVGYFLFEVPSNLIMQRVGARRWIARIMLSWGAVSTCMMFVHSPVSFYALRFLLGVAEAGFYPGIVLYLTYWVPGHVRAQVLARFLALTTVLGLFGGPLGGVLLQLNGIGGLKGWQWLFVLEGVPSLLFGLVVWRVLPDSPAQANWLTQAEKDAIADGLAHDAGDTGRMQHLSFRAALADPRLLLMCLIFILTATGGNAIGFFGPQLIKSRSGGLWSDSYVATILTLPAIVGAIAMTLAAAHSDKTGLRRQHVVIGYAIAALGFVCCVYAPTAPLTLLALSLNALGERIAAGSYWAMTSNLLGVRAAAGGIAFINSVGNLGGFFGPPLMAELKRVTHGGYAAGLWAAALLVFLGAALALFLRSAPARALPDVPQ